MAKGPKLVVGIARGRSSRVDGSVDEPVGISPFSCTRDKTPALRLKLFGRDGVQVRVMRTRLLFIVFNGVDEVEGDIQRPGSRAARLTLKIFRRRTTHRLMPLVEELATK